jgi:carotenoid 1,2-hydratase
LIAFVGSVFSPYYAWSRRRGTPDPGAHSAMNVALYGRDGHRWAMTERGPRSMTATPQHLAIGPSRLDWNGRRLTAEIDEVTAPLPSRVIGEVELEPLCLTGFTATIDAEERHRWSPLAPLSRVTVRLDRPKMTWSGQAYFDGNSGDDPLEAAFERWDWSRTIERDRTRILYDVTTASGESSAMALACDATGRVSEADVPPTADLGRTFWRLKRQTRADQGSSPRVRATWEDGPFYARSLIETSIGGDPVLAIHETLSLTRFRQPIVQAMLPFRMPRRSHAPRA